MAVESVRPGRRRRARSWQRSRAPGRRHARAAGWRRSALSQWHAQALVVLFVVGVALAVVPAAEPRREEAVDLAEHPGQRRDQIVAIVELDQAHVRLLARERP